MQQNQYKGTCTKEPLPSVLCTDAIEPVQGHQYQGTITKSTNAIEPVQRYQYQGTITKSTYTIGTSTKVPLPRNHYQVYLYNGNNGNQYKGTNYLYQGTSAKSTNAIEPVQRYQYQGTITKSTYTMGTSTYIQQVSHLYEQQGIDTKLVSSALQYLCPLICLKVFYTT